MTEREFESELEAALLDEGSAAELQEQVKSIRTFDGAMLMTRNKGLVIKMHNGDEFHVTIVKG